MAATRQVMVAAALALVGAACSGSAQPSTAPEPVPATTVVTRTTIDAVVASTAVATTSTANVADGSTTTSTAAVVIDDVATSTEVPESTTTSVVATTTGPPAPTTTGPPGTTEPPPPTTTTPLPPTTTAAPAPTTTVRRLQPPGAPSNVNLMPGGMGLTLTWLAPADIGGSAIIAYQVEYSTDGQVWHTCGGLRPPDSRSLALSGVDWSESQRVFQFRVLALNDDGAGPSWWPMMAMLPGPATGEPGFCSGGATVDPSASFGQPIIGEVTITEEVIQTSFGQTIYDSWSDADIRARIIAQVAALDATAGSAFSDADRSAVHEMAQRIRWAVVHVSMPGKGGTATFVSPDGYLVTNAHVVEGGGPYEVVTFDGEVYSARLVAMEASLSPDLAILKVDGSGFPFAALGTETTVGDVITYVGHPGAVFWAASAGRVTGFDETATSPLVLYSNPTTEGSSGSALIDLNGRIVGLVAGGSGTVVDRASTIARLQNEPVWDYVEYLQLFDNLRSGPTIGVLRSYLQEHVPGLVAANDAAIDQAVTSSDEFVAPLPDADLCRPCLTFQDPTLVSYMAEDTLANQAAFLDMVVAAELQPTGLTATQKASARSAGLGIQDAVVLLEAGDSAGTGSFISPDGYIITNAHVVADNTSMTVRTFDGRSFIGRPVGQVPHPGWQPDLALLKVDATGLPWIPLADSVVVDQLVVGVGHPQGLDWAIYGGRVTYMDPEIFWDGGSPVQYDLQYDAVSVGKGSSGSPIVNMDGKIVAVLANDMVDLAAPASWRHLDGEWMEPAVVWKTENLTAALNGRSGGPHVDLVREFVEIRVPGMLAALPE